MSLFIWAYLLFRLLSVIFVSMGQNKYPKLNLPNAPLKIREEDGVLKVYDALRGKFVTLTPEEYVRQHFVNWLQTGLNYPLSLMANEIGIELNGMCKRCDTVVFRPDGNPLMIIEYKAPDVEITQDVFDQIVRYNMVLRASYLVVSNGRQHYCCVIDYTGNSYNFIREIPSYDSIRTPFSSN